MTEPTEPYDAMQYVSCKDVKELADRGGCTCLACQAALGRHKATYGDFIPSLPDSGISHTDGRWWHEAPLPSRWHRCKAHTTGGAGSLSLVDRCACGAIRLSRLGGWMDRNSRRRRL